MVGRILEGDSTVMRPTEVGRSPDYGLDSPISGFCQARQLYDQPFNSAARSFRCQTVQRDADATGFGATSERRNVNTLACSSGGRRKNRFAESWASPP